MDNGTENYKKYLSGDVGGLSELVREYRDGLILYINGFVCDPGTAEDLAEDTFLRLIVKKPRFDGRSSFKTWLYGIGRNLALDKLRKDKRRKASALDENAADTKELEASFIKNELTSAVRSCMKRLSPDKYELIWLSYFEGMSAKEIASVTGKSEGAIFKTLSRARAELKEMLTEKGFGYEDL